MTLSQDEIREIKAQNSRNHRAAQTTRNLVWALVATLLVVLAVVLVVVRPDPASGPAIDYRTVASQAQGGIDTALAAPDLPDGWVANAAELRTRASVAAWYIGFITPKEQFIALNQGFDANDTWVDGLLESNAPTGSTSIGGVSWTVYDHRDAKEPGNLAYALVTTIGASTYVLHGTADDAEFAELAVELTDD